MKKKLTVLACAAALAAAQPVLASDTSSSIRGLILNPMGKGAVNTTITIKHEPTGATKVVKPNESGAFVVRGLRVGGPYTLILDSEKYEDQEVNDVYLEVGKPFQLNHIFEAEGTENVLKITATRGDLRYPNSGSNSIFSSQDIENSASFARDLKDTLRRNPLVNLDHDDGSSMSIAGNNPRFNSISVDGVRQDDDFGLNFNGYPTQRSPISIDAVEQVSIQANPFDASQGGFSGGKISVVTKSGTNEFKGSAFYEKADGDWTGDPLEGSIENLDEETYGFGVGGPLIKDKLFFYANYEKYERSQDPALFPTAGTNQQEVLEEVITIARDVYGVDAGRWDVAPVEEDEKILIKLDWDINEFHRASFTYQNTDGQVTQGWPRSTTDNPDFELSSDWTTRGDELQSISAHWYADWTDRFSTEVKITNKETDNLQVPLNGKGFGAVTVTTQMEFFNEDGILESDSRDVRLGPDSNRHANDLTNDTFSINFDGQYLLNDHTISFGWQHEELDVFNIFIPDSLGSWEFDSIEDFRDGIASDFDYQNADSNNPADGAAAFSYTYDNFYIQDIWDYSVDWQFGLGLRIETVSTDDAPRLNENFVTRYGFSNQENLDGETLYLPRFSFKYLGFEDVELTGGFGLFSGGRPNVWISNAFTNDGVTIVRPNFNNIASNNYLQNADITQVDPEVIALLEAGDGNSTPIDPEFEIPTHWQYSLAANFKTDLGWLGDNWELASEVIYKDIVKDVRWIDLARGQLGTTVEGRPIYGRYDPVTMNEEHYDILMTNGEGGDSLITTFSAYKAWDNGLKLNIGYTHQDINEIVNAASSTANSGYQFNVAVDRQNPTVATASYETEHALVISLDYSTEFFEGYATNFNVFFKRNSGRPFSWTMGAFRDDDLGDPDAFDDADSYLPYIPTGADDPAVDFVNGLSYEEIIAHLQANGISTEGGYLARNAYNSPWNTTMDVSIRQEIPGLFDDNKGEFYFIIDNFLNLLDEDKGQIYYNRFGDTTQILFDYDINENGQYVYDEPFGGYNFGDPATYRADRSVWRIKMGFKYKF